MTDPICLFHQGFLGGTNNTPHNSVDSVPTSNLVCINTFPNKPWFLRVCSGSLLKTLWEKEKLLVTSNFSFSHSVFYPFEKLSAIFILLEIFVCKLLQFGRVQNLSSDERVKEAAIRTTFSLMISIAGNSLHLQLSY